METQQIEAISTTIASLFGYNLPEHEIKRRLAAIIKGVYAEGQRNPPVKAFTKEVGTTGVRIRGKRPA